MRAAGNRDRVPDDDYRDEGCRYWRTCLSCPFPRCVFEEPGGPARALRAGRDREIRRRFARGETAPAIAVRFGLTRRSVYRIVEDSREPAAGSREKNEPLTAGCRLPAAPRPKGGNHVWDALPQLIARMDGERLRRYRANLVLLPWRQWPGTTLARLLYLQLCPRCRQVTSYLMGAGSTSRSICRTTRRRGRRAPADGGGARHVHEGRRTWPSSTSTRRWTPRCWATAPSR